jgi:hypothetical protein
MTRYAALKTVRRRAKQAGLLTAVCCRSFPVTGIITYLENGGTLEFAIHAKLGAVPPLNRCS